MIELAPNDEVALYVTNFSSTGNITLLRGRLVASTVGKEGATGATGPAGSGAGTLSQTLLLGNTASTDIDMNQYQIQNVSVIDADGNVGIHTINMINASLLTLMYNT
jgi:hypothetical protein